jgi:uncharacterized metal-binding protein
MLDYATPEEVEKYFGSTIVKNEVGDKVDILLQLEISNDVIFIKQVKYNNPESVIFLL